MEYIVRLSDKVNDDGSQSVLSKQRLVRCKDCVWHENNTGECSNIDSLCWRNGCAMDDFFCAEGVLKDK